MLPDSIVAALKELQTALVEREKAKRPSSFNAARSRVAKARLALDAQLLQVESV